MLAVLIVAALAFAGGVLVQKAHDRSLVSASATRARTGGGFGGAGGTPPTPVAVGTVKSVSGTTLTLTNFGGTVITVTVPPTATVTTDGLAAIAPGATVSVAGTTAPDGTVTASSITGHRSGG